MPQFTVRFIWHGRSLSMTVGAWNAMAAAQTVEMLYPGCQISSTTQVRGY